MRVLVANFFPAFHPPRSGGEQRYHYLYRHLSRHYDVTLLSPTHSGHPFEEVRFSSTFRESRVPKAAVFDRLHWLLDAKSIGPECSAYVVALAAGVEHEYGERFAAASAEADLVIHESPFTLPYDRSFGIDGKPRIYNAYNVEHRLARQILHGTAGAEAADFIAFLERTLARNAALLFATSDEDRALLAADFGVPLERIALAPNGFEPEGSESASRIERDASRVAFMGSAHPPNVEAARFIVERLAPEMPALQFRILGAVCDKLQSIRVPDNVRLLGLVDGASKRRELQTCALALNPMFAGSGTNLKMLDYLAAGAPVVTTPTGARGLDLDDGVDALVAEGRDFTHRVAQALGDPLLRASIGETGRAKAFSQFTWAQIADRVHASIEATVASRRSTIARRGGRPLLLHVNDFSVVDGIAGGEVRIRELLVELGREFDVVLLCMTHEATRSDHRLGPHALEIRIPKTIAHRDAEVQAARGESVSIGDLLAAEFCERNGALVSTFSELAAQACVVVFEHPYLAPLIRHLPDAKPVVYSSLNVECRLKAQLLRGRRDASRRIAQVRALERGIVDRATLTVCVSEDDRDAFVEEFGRHEFVVVENGVRASRTAAQGNRLRRSYASGRFLGVFVGSAHPPNVEAARFLIDVLAAALPKLDIAIVGSVCSALGVLRMPANVHRLGVLTDAEKNALLARADVALNPLFQGGGSSLKVPDFLASGVPMISTRTGARGYLLDDGRHYVEADRETFAERTRALLDDSALRERIGNEARRYAAQTLDWTVLGRRYRRALEQLIDHAARPRVLVVTYRFADPPPGGAETFLVRTLQALHARGNLLIDVATCDVTTIRDKWHFCAEYGRNAPGPTRPPYVDSLFRFALDQPPEDDFERCRRLFHVWMAETREQALSFIEQDRPMLLGGWNFPEDIGTIRRWTSSQSQVRVGPGTTELRIRGDAPSPAVVEIVRGGNRVASRMVDGSFDWHARIGHGDAVISLVVTPAYAPKGDPRELGIVVDGIECNDGGDWDAIPLDSDFERVARREDNERWVQSLIALTERRAHDDDQLFYLVRGPHSARLADWLEGAIRSYDVVLAHGTPFSTPVLAAKIALRHAVPVVALPHFHMEDRYYHWRFYYDAFRSAQRVIAAPESSKVAFFDRIGASAVTIPGGGIDPREFRDDVLAAAEQDFQRVHHGTLPYVLVLGRKTAAKNYRLAVEAMAALNASGHRIDLVLIGPDEDGVAIRAPHVFCHGAQSRSVVLGALRCSLCLVNMSESESFGIVLLESWLAGRPVIAQRRCAAFTDLVIDDENGRLVETAAELAEAIETYLGDDACARRHARNGRQVAERHAWSRIAEQIETVLLEASRVSSSAGSASTAGAVTAV